MISMNRRQMREQTFKELFFREFYEDCEYEKQLKLYLEEQEELEEADRALLDARAEAVCEKIPQLDEKINEVAKGWKTNRMGKVDLAILRLAIFEMLYDEEIPEKVAINEAVELAKSYGTDESPAFINGILGKLVPDAESDLQSRTD